MKKYFFAFALLLFLTDGVAADSWRNYANPFPIRDAFAYGDGVMMATAGGIRYRTTSYDYTFTSVDGLETSSFYSIVPSFAGIFALSEYGKVVYFDTQTNRWRVINRSFESNKSRVIPGVSVAAKGIISIAFDDRLAFFDIGKASSIITIDRIASKNFSSDKITSLVAKDDSLYVRLQSDVYVRKMDWDNLSKDVRLNDPDSWSKVDGSVEIEGLEKNNGTWEFKNSQGSYKVDSTSIIYTQNGEETNLSFVMSFLLGSAYEIRALPSGGVLAVSEYGYIGSSENGNRWNVREPIYDVGNVGPALDVHMKEASVLPDGSVFYHLWYGDYFILSDWGDKTKYTFRGTDGHCFDNFDGAPISIASTPAPDGSGFLTASGSRDGYSLVYFTKQGEVHCANNIGSALIGGPMQAIIDEDGSWVVYVGTNKSTGVVNDGDLDIIRFPSPRSKGNEIVNATVNTVTGIYPSPIDIAYDSASKRLWLVSLSTLAYYDADQDTILSPRSTKGLQGAEFSSLELDNQGNLWVGTSNQGVYRLTQKGKSPDTLSVEHFTTRDGLLSNNVADLAIDPIYGVAWFAHGKGLSSYTRKDLRRTTEYMTDETSLKVTAYPVPFRPKVHKFFVIDNISDKATAAIYNRGGALMRSFRGEDVVGGRLEWDGTDKENRMVAPGVYYYVVNGPSKTVKGKFIIIH